MNMDALFTFEDTPWQQALETLVPGEKMDAVSFLALTEGLDEEELEACFLDLEAREITLDIGKLPKTPGDGETADRLWLEELLVKREDLASGLEPEDPLRLYLQDLAGMPGNGSISALAEKLASGGGDTVRSALVDLCLPRVVEIAREYTGCGVLLLDLIQEGNLGLWQGTLSWNGERAFEDYRDWWIRQYMVRAVVRQARQYGVGQRMRRAMEDYSQVDERLLTDLGRNPTPAEIAEQLHITPEEGELIGKMLENVRSLGKIKVRQKLLEETPEDDQPVEDTAYFQMRQRIGELLSDLEPLDGRILNLRFGLEGGKPLSPGETGRVLGLSAEEVTARETAALAGLRSRNEK